MAGSDGALRGAGQHGGDTLTSTLHYLKRGTEKPASYRIEPPPGVPRWNGIDDPHDVTG